MSFSAVKQFESDLAQYWGSNYAVSLLKTHDPCYQLFKDGLRRRYHPCFAAGAIRSSL